MSTFAAFRMARRWLKGERERSFVFAEVLRKKYDELAPEPLNSFIQFSCEIGICEGEMIDLLKADVHMREKADEWGHYGYVHIRNGKTEFRASATSQLLIGERQMMAGAAH